MLSRSDGVRGSDRVRVEVVGAIAVAGLALTAVGLRRARHPDSQRETDQKQAALATYLREHLTGADAAIEVVRRLKTTQPAPDSVLFESLFEDFRQERAVVRALLSELGESAMSAKRAAGRMTGKLLRAASGGERGQLALFRTLEALAVGVQGKRCMWRALQLFTPPLRASGRRSFVALEALAVNQWESIEQRRQLLATRTFAVVKGVSHG